MVATYTGTNASKPPISQHPAFPAIVALWFAALLGIGSLVLPVTLFESLIVAAGLPAVIPAAEPPLGVAARILIALVGAGLGAVVGLFVARKVVAAQSAARPATRPISAHEELGAESFDEPVEDMRAAAIPGRRRALSITEESGPSTLLDYAPLPGADTQVMVAPDRADEPAASDALDLAAFADPAESPEPVDEGGETRPFDAPEFVSPAESETERAETAIDLPVEFKTAEEERVEPTLAATGAIDNPDGRPLEELSITELVGRFALSLQRAAERAEADLPGVGLPARYVPDLGVEAVEAPRLTAPPESEPRLAAAPEVMPAALRPLALDDEPTDDEDDDLSLTLTLSREARPFSHPPVDPATAAQIATDDEESEDVLAEDAYGSLLNVRKPESEREFVRIEQGDAGDGAIEPVVIFPGHEERRAVPASDGPAREPTALLMAAGRPFDAP